LLGLVLAGCATANPPVQMGTMSTLSAARSSNYQLCPHKVPQEVCTRCNPQLIPTFKAANDWCPPHGVPESQCYQCHPDLNFDPLPPLPAGADLKEISKQGEDVPSLEAHLAAGKVTVFDFYAIWCGPCRKIDAHLFALMGHGKDVAVRKLNVVDWESAVAGRYMKGVTDLPFVVVYGKDGKKVRAISGLDLAALDKAIADGRRP
jgi:thiol-disulfide isomerase/thioredoxin